MQKVTKENRPKKKKRTTFEKGSKHVQSTKPKSLADSDLPIHSHREEILKSVKQYRTTIIVGETGSGKSTQLPQFLADSTDLNHKCVVCTQPRRVAAVTIAQRVASERGGSVGHEVGYSIRFEDKSNPKETKIKFVTDGVLLRECMGDTNLEKYNIVILDEAHERSLQTDILMGLLKELQERREDLRIIIMSATLQVELFSEFFLDTSVVRVSGRQFPVEVFYVSEPESDFVDAALLTCLQIHEEADKHSSDGDLGGILVFLPGQEDIESLQLLLHEHLPTIERRSTTSATTKKKSRSTANISSIEAKAASEPPSSPSPSSQFANDFDVRPLYAALPPDEQLKVFAQSGKGVRRIILSTNIAETSVTITGIKYVVDTGYVKMRLIHPVTGVEMLKVMPVSRAQALQRTGRAGRERAGQCYRLYTEDTFESCLELTTSPEIQRINISQVLLQLKEMGIKSPAQFPFPSPPAPVALRKGFELLLSLGALHPSQALTPHGRAMAALPLDPQQAHFLLKAHELGCTSEALTAVSMLSADNVLLRPHNKEQRRAANAAHRNFASKDGDLPTLVNIYLSWTKVNRDKLWTARNFLSYRALQHASSVRTQLSTLLKTKLDIDPDVACYPERTPFLKCLLAGLFLNVARKVTALGNISSSSSSSSSNGGSSSGNGKFSFSRPRAKDAVHANIIGDDTAAYVTLRGSQPVHVHPSSVLFSMVRAQNKPSGSGGGVNGGIVASRGRVGGKQVGKDNLPEYVVFAELLITSKQYMRYVSVVEGDWLMEMFPSQFKK